MHDDGYFDERVAARYDARMSGSRRVSRLLLRKATETLVDHGVWRVYCDTAARERADDPPLRERRMDPAGGGETVCQAPATCARSAFMIRTMVPEAMLVPDRARARVIR